METMAVAVAAGMALIGLLNKPSSVYRDDPNEKENADGVHGHLEAIGESCHKPSLYEKYVKRSMDIFFMLWRTCYFVPAVSWNL